MSHGEKSKGRDRGMPGRRRFIAAGCSACAGGLLAGPRLARAKKPGGKVRIRIVYSLQSVTQKKPDWPNMGFEFAPVMEKINNTLENALPEFEFLPAIANGGFDAEAILARDALANIDGYMVVQMNNWSLAFLPIAATCKPVLYVNFKYGGTGGFLVNAATMLRQGRKNVGFVSSPEPDDLIAAVKCFEQAKRDGSAKGFAEAVARLRRERTPGSGDLSCLPDPVATVPASEAIRAMKESKILAIGYPGVSFMGLPMIPVKMLSFGALNRAWKAADRDRAREIAARWQKDAELIEGVSTETLESSAAMHLGMMSLLEKHRANAITVNCLVGFYSGQIHAYPCMGFHEMLNQGLVGACECDVRSAATMLAVNALTGGRPGYISDPELDTSTRRIIYAHCVASNRPFGPDGPANPFEILTHSEDRKGASVRSLLPPGYMTTTLEFCAERRQVLIHRAKSVGNDPDDRACRTKLVAEPVGDFEKLFTRWDRWGWHRVTVYGDVADAVGDLADAIGYKVVEEA